MSKDFAVTYGAWAVVTGASSGIGEAFAHALAARGVRSLLVARREDELQRVSREVRGASGIECDVLARDLAEPSFVDDLAAQCAGRDVGLVVSNAGYNPAGSFLSLSREEVVRVLDVNDRAPLLLANAFLPGLVERGRGGFLITGSVEGFVGAPHSAVYSSSKAFALSFGEALWGELREQGVDVLVLSPGPTDTPLLRSRNLPKLPGTLSARAVAEFGLEQLGRGPSAIPGALNRWMVRVLTSMPRRAAVRRLGTSIKAMLDRAGES